MRMFALHYGNDSNGQTALAATVAETAFAYIACGKPKPEHGGASEPNEQASERERAARFAYMNSGQVCSCDVVVIWVGSYAKRTRVRVFVCEMMRAKCGWRRPPQNVRSTVVFFKGEAWLRQLVVQCTTAPHNNGAFWVSAHVGETHDVGHVTR